MKQLTNFFKAIYLFFFRLTPKGREAQYYDTALNNMKETRTLSILEKRALKLQIRHFLGKALRKRSLTIHQQGELIKNKFSAELEAAGLKYNAKKREFQNA